MKKTVILLLALLTSSSLFAGRIVVDKVTQTKKFVTACERCTGEEVVTTTFQFSKNSCRRFDDENFSIKVNTGSLFRYTKPERTVLIEAEPNLWDCRGINKRQTYKISTTEIYPGERYILENASALSISEPSSLPRVAKCSPNTLGKACMKANETIGVCIWQAFHYYPSCN